VISRTLWASSSVSNQATETSDEQYMAMALSLARRGLGQVWPNPAVGCVLVNDHRVVGRGWTQPGGRPHAETEALARAGDAAAGADAYVTLEPCSHSGKTPPCADALISAGVGRVISAMEDPDPRVSGNGHDRLRAARINVTRSVGGAAAERINAGFLMRIRAGRPMVALKSAASMDGRIATAAGESQWITNEHARARGHVLRATYDAIMVGVETALADDPSLTVRLPGLEDRSPVRVVVDSRLRLPITSRLVAGARKQPSWVVTVKGADPGRRQALTAAGVEVIEVDAGGGGRPDPAAVLAALGRRGVTRLLVEGGAGLAASLMAAELIDKVYCFRAGMMIGGDGRPALDGFGLTTLDQAPRFESVGIEQLSGDILEIWHRTT